MKKIFGLFLLVLSFACSQKEVKTIKPFIGDDVIIQADSKVITVANDRESLDALVKAAMAKDEDRFNALILANRAFPIESGTKGRITDYDNAGYEIKILEGKFKDRYIWTGKSSFKPLQTK